jgi:hypothetical protein
MNRLAALVLFLSSPLMMAQTPTHKTPSSTSLLAVPKDWPNFSTRMFQDASLKIVFHLTTSWIPGPDHKGSFRFKLMAAPERAALAEDQDKSSELYGPEATASLLRRVHNCVIDIELYDSDGFVLRDVPVPFSLGMGSSGNLVALSANNAVQMDADEYKKFIVGSWIVTWTPDPLPRIKD